MTCADYVSLAKDLVLIGAALVGATVAIKGLGTWQRQLKGKSEYDLSRRLLVSLFKYRDAINGVRNSTMFSYEMQKPPKDEAEKMSWEQISFYGTSKAYQKRWDEVQHECTSLYADLLEAEALWGVELKKMFKVLFALQHELWSCTRQHLILLNPDTSAAKKEAIQKRPSKGHDILYADPGEESDEFKKKFMVGVESIENLLKPKLTH